MNPSENPIPLINADLPPFDEIADEFASVIASGQVTNFGKKVQAFEREAESYLGAHVATTSSGTLALLFALEACGGVKEKEIILPSFTFVATAQAVIHAGAHPYFCDIGEDFTLSPTDLEKILADRGERSEAVMPVHTYGMPCSTNEIEAVVTEAGERLGKSIPVIYDAAHAFGSAIDEQKVGIFGDAEVFSLSATKALVSVEGGIVASKDEKLIDRIKKLRNYGIGENYEAYWPGLNGKMSELHAIVGLYNLRRLDSLVERRQELAHEFATAITDRTNFVTIPVRDGVTHTHKDFTVLVPNSLNGRRDEVMDLLKDKGIETRRYFWPPLHQHRYFRQFAQRELPLTEELGQRVINLPFFTSMTSDQIDRVVDALAETEKALAG